MGLFDRQEFDELYVVSDLHLGGEKRVETNFQIFDQGDLLEAWLNGLSQETQKQIGLVINGDTVDFLAEPRATHFDPKGAADRLERIFQDPSFVPVWRGLETFLKAPNRRLAITLGNHDLELALPWVRERLIEKLSGGDASVRGRIALSLDGTGFRCQVGGARVLCVHGNEADNWNATDYEKLRRITRDLIWGQNFDGWETNAGTRLVIEVMNDVKRLYPFIDLLKPQTEAAVPILLLLDPSLARKLDEICGLAILSRTKGWREVGFLGAGEAAPEPVELMPGQALATVLRRSFRASTADPVPRLLEEAEERRRARETGARLPAAEAAEFLGTGGAIWAAISGKDPSEIMREALERLKNDPTFDLTRRDKWVQELDELVGTEVNFLLAGHEHLERALARRSGSGYYYNSGTWARLIQLTPEMLDDETRFARVFHALKAGTMPALDAEEGLVISRPTVVCIWKEGNSVHGELRRAEMKGAAVSLEPVPQSRHTWQ